MNINEAKAWVAEHKIEHFKFVRVKGEYRFGPVGSNHADLACDGVESAATIRVYKDHCVIEGYSTTLNKSYDQQDVDNLPKLFGVPLDYD